MDKNFQHIKVISLCVLIFTFCHVTYTCSGFSGLGHTYPSGDIFIEYNTSTPLEITCVITNDTLIRNNPNISSKLYFKKDKGYVSDEKIIRLNNTSVKLREENPEKMSTFYDCMLNGSTICLNNVVVGTKPLRVEDFKCLGNNYENLTCSWTPPNNYVSTNYKLSYTFPKVRPGKHKSHMVNSTKLKPRAQSRPTDCNVTDDVVTKKKKCFWSLDTTPHYRQVSPQYNFTLKMENRFGTLEQVFLFDHWKNILSEPPENLSVINSTTSSLFLSWKIPTTIAPFSNGLEHRILYQCRFGPKIWQNGGLFVTNDKKDVTFNLTGLKHAHDFCDVRVSMRVKGADSEEMWSSNSSITALTSSTIPGAPPKVNIGSFQAEITSTNLRVIYVYWQQIPMKIRNADNFQYTVSDDDNNGNKLAEITNSYARFTNMSLNTRYKFTIKSKNSEGESKESAVLKIPASDEMIGEPVSFKKVAFENGLFKLSWGKPKKGAEYVQNYTLFWCFNDKDRPYQCTGYLNWTEVPASTTEYNITVPENTTTQFAISANNATSSSGMVWATCTLIHNKSITKLKEVWIASVGSTFIQLGWKLDCADGSDSVTGYVIYYCPRTKDLVCQKQLNITINNPEAVSARVAGLTPYTTYMLNVSVMDKHGTQSVESDTLFNTTFEAAPTEPYSLKATSITNSSISISWEPPKKPNGFLRFYSVYYADRNIETTDNKTTFTLYGLDGDTVYNISVSACTSSCSNRSLPLIIRTKTGHPGKIQRIWSIPENNTLRFYWVKPDEGKQPNLYQLKLTYIYNHENVSLPIVITTGNNYGLYCQEDNKHLLYYYSVRAVNQDKSTNYTGPWSDEEKASCDQTINDSSLIWITIVIGCLFLLFVMFFSGKKLYIHFNEMKTIDVKMPPGLDPQINTNWTQPKPIISPSDEERLLHKSYINPGDSSGCSSGQESVASDSGSSIVSSTSDSGTEQPRTPTNEEPKTLLTNVNGLKTNENQLYNNGYSMYGISNSTNNSDIELMSVPKSNSESPYLTCDQIMKPVEEPRSVTNTYVPLSNTQDKNPPYVMAANKNVIMSNLFYPNVIANVDERA